MIFSSLFDSTDEDGVLQTWTLEELTRQAQIYARHYEVEQGGPIPEWAFTEFAVVNLRLTRIENESKVHGQWNDMFERWKDARILKLHAAHINDDSCFVSAEDVSMHIFEDEMRHAMRRLGIDQGVGSGS